MDSNRFIIIRSIEHTRTALSNISYITYIHTYIQLHAHRNK